MKAEKPRIKKTKPFKEQEITEKQVLDAINDYANGKTVKQVIDKLGIGYWSFYYLIEEKYKLLPMYTHAKQIHTSAIQAEMDDVIEKTKKGIYKSDVSRVVIDALKWKLSKYYPKMYGDKVDMTTNGKEIKQENHIDLTLVSTDVLKALHDATKAKG
jgi:hypothetical protein